MTLTLYDGCFCISVNILYLYSGVEISFLVWFFQVLLLNFARQDQSSILCMVNFPTTAIKAFWGLFLDIPSIKRFFIPAGGGLFSALVQVLLTLILLGGSFFSVGSLTYMYFSCTYMRRLEKELYRSLKMQLFLL